MTNLANFAPKGLAAANSPTVSEHLRFTEALPWKSSAVVA